MGDLRAGRCGDSCWNAADSRVVVQGCMEYQMTPRSLPIPREIVDHETASAQADTVYLKLQQLFDEADADDSGALDEDELSWVLKKYYADEKMSRSLKAVKAEVAMAMTRFDANLNGTLEFGEFVNMFCLSETFKFKMPLQVKLQVKVRQAVDELTVKWEEAWYLREQEVQDEREHLSDQLGQQQHQVSRLERKVKTLTANQMDLSYLNTISPEELSGYPDILPSSTRSRTNSRTPRRQQQDFGMS